MIVEIESIVKADDAARDGVEAAREEAERLRARSLRQAEDAISRKKNELAVSIGEEVERILDEAHSKSGKVLEETSHYIQGIREKKTAILNDLVEDLFGKVTGP